MDAPCPECGASIPVLSTGRLASHYRYKNKQADGLCGGHTMTDTRYNGWKNWETWNVALWLNNDEPLYRVMRNTARMGGTYADLVEFLREFFGVTETPDGAAYNDSGLDTDALNEMMREEVEEES